MVSFKNIVGLSQIFGGVFLIAFTSYVISRLPSEEVFSELIGIFLIFLASIIGILFIFQGIINIKEIISESIMQD